MEKLNNCQTLLINQDGNDIQNLIDHTPVGRYQILIGILCFLILFLDGLDTAAMGFIAPVLIQEWAINKADLGPVMSAALGGMIIGALISGLLADRFGRKIVIVLAILIFGMFSILSALVNNLDQLVLLRFLTGVGLGAAMPNVTTVLSEYSPKRLRSFLVTAMFCGFNLGMAMSGFISSWLIPHLGWRSFFLFGGILPIILAMFVMVLLPESLRYLMVQGAEQERIRAILSLIIPREEVCKIKTFMLGTGPSEKGSLAYIISTPYRVGTILLWSAYFMGLVIIYLLTSWLPLLLKASGASIEQATFMGGYINLEEY